MPQSARQSTATGEQTRAAILEAAERIFAEKGFDRARLEDVAESVGIRRASIVYYFKDKRILYDAVLGGVFGDFRASLEAVLSRDATASELIESAIAAWVDYVGGRPTFAHILLREVAETGSERGPTVLPHIQPFAEVVRGFMQRHAGEPVITQPQIDPTHIASTIAGATVFFVAAMPALMPDKGFDPLSAERLSTHKAEVLKIARRLLVRPAAVDASRGQRSTGARGGSRPSR